MAALLLDGRAQWRRQELGKVEGRVSRLIMTSWRHLKIDLAVWGDLARGTSEAPSTVAPPVPVGRQHMTGPLPGLTSTLKETVF